MIDPIVAAARFIGSQLEWLRHSLDGTEPYAMRALDEIAESARQIRHLVDGPAAQKYLGPCGAVEQVDITTFGHRPGSQTMDGPACDGDVYVRGGAQRGRCRTCGAEVARADREAWLDAEVRSWAYRASEIANAYGVNVKTIRSWADRGHLAQHGQDRDGRPLYNLGEVLDLAAADAARREGDRATRARRSAARAADDERLSA
jgi:hypothetical protein